MADPDGISRSLPLNVLAHNCARQTLLFFEHFSSDTRYCFEIFRRAIVEKDGQAWSLLHELYQNQLRRWVRRHPSYGMCREEEDYFTNRAMEKFWQAVSASQFARFPDISHLLSYLQMCVNSAICEYLRDLVRDKYEVDLEEAEQRVGGEQFEDEVFDRKQATDLWRLILERMKDAKEIHVAYDSFQLDLKPGEIIERHPALFESTQEIYRIKENILSRLRRDEEVLTMAGLRPESRAKMRSSC